MKVTLLDAKDGLKLGLSYAATHALPQSLWPPLATALAAADLLVKRRFNRTYYSHLKSYLGPWEEDPVLRKILRRSVAESYLERLAFMADLQGDRWQPTCRVLGAEALAAATEAGKGAILWGAPMGFASNVQKIAFYKLGYPLCHLSVHGHGVSESAFAHRYLNPLIVNTENRYLMERVVIDDDCAPNSFLRLVAHLRKNRVVSIRLVDYARKCLRVPFLAGSLLIPVGPVALARMTGAPLHPLVTIKTGKKSFDLQILPALPAHDFADEAEASVQVALTLAKSFEKVARQHPALWRGWWMMRRAEKSGLEILSPAKDAPQRAPRRAADFSAAAQPHLSEA